MKYPRAQLRRGVAQARYGGGAGSWTRVRRPSAQRIYMCSRSF